MSRALRTAFGAAVLLGLAALAGCAERDQASAQSRVKKTDAKAWDIAQSPYVAPGWKAGDQASWEQQMRSRAATQNEYNRIAAQPQ